MSSKSKSERFRRGREQRQADAVTLGSEACEIRTTWQVNAHSLQEYSASM